MKKWLLVVLICVFILPVAKSQCSVCTKTAAGLDDKSAKGLNGGIVYLAFIPLTIMGALGFVWYQYNKNV
jgi:hypothetical protein